MGLIIHGRPFKKVFVKRNPKLKQQQQFFGFIKYVRKRNILQKKNFVRLFNHPLPERQPERQPEHQPRPQYDNIFEYINLTSNGNISKTILTDLTDYEKYTDFDIHPVPTEILHDDENISRILNVYSFLYNNGGIYLNQKIKTHPSVFLKNDFIGVNINLFSCVKYSSVMKKILDEASKENTMESIIQSFNKNIEGHQFNKSIHFLI